MQAAAAPATDLEAQVIEFTGCSLTVARAAIEAAGPAGLERAVDLALSGECTLPSAGPPQSAGPHKAVCLVRRDLNMGSGKVAAQVAHACLGVYRLAHDRCPAVLQAQIDEAGAAVRKLKEEDGLTNADPAVKAAVAELLRLKAMAEE